MKQILGCPEVLLYKNSTFEVQDTRGTGHLVTVTNSDAGLACILYSGKGRVLHLVQHKQVGIIYFPVKSQPGSLSVLFLGTAHVGVMYDSCTETEHTPLSRLHSKHHVPQLHRNKSPRYRLRFLVSITYNSCIVTEHTLLSRLFSRCHTTIVPRQRQH